MTELALTVEVSDNPLLLLHLFFLSNPLLPNYYTENFWSLLSQQYFIFFKGPQSPLENNMQQPLQL